MSATDDIEIPSELRGSMRAGCHASSLRNRRSIMIKKLYTERLLSVRELARLFQISTASVHDDLATERAGVPAVARRGPVRRFTPEQEAKILTARAANVPVQDLAAAYGITPVALNSWLYRARRRTVGTEEQRQ